METPHPPQTAEFGHVVPGGPAHTYPDAAITVHKVAVGSFNNNVYVIASGGQALIVDGAADAARIIDLARGLQVTAIVQTHGHFDHVQALPELVDEFGCDVYAHPGDAIRMPVPVKAIADGQVFQLGDRKVRTLHTPGHTPGSTCFITGQFLFSGDTLFPAGPGNTEGDPARFSQIMEQLDTKLFVLPDSTRVCPGHGLDTFIGREREYVETWRARGW